MNLDGHISIVEIEAFSRSCQDAWSEKYENFAS